mmetsp:Transcript_26625/g.79848  ORF Transcript_26625/g.79848 Transcript_26625/m.79848 type:complete len:238 (-) Transcript_26625:211-924(-)
MVEGQRRVRRVRVRRRLLPREDVRQQRREAFARGPEDLVQALGGHAALELVEGAVVRLRRAEFGPSSRRDLPLERHHLRQRRGEAREVRGLPGALPRHEALALQPRLALGELLGLARRVVEVQHGVAAVRGRAGIVQREAAHGVDGRAHRLARLLGVDHARERLLLRGPGGRGARRHEDLLVVAQDALDLLEPRHLAQLLLERLVRVHRRGPQRRARPTPRGAAPKGTSRAREHHKR